MHRRPFTRPGFRPTTPLIIAGCLLLQGCSDVPGGSTSTSAALPAPAYAPYPFIYPKGGEPWARALHMRRVLEDHAARSPEPFRLLGRECGGFGRAAAAAWTPQEFHASDLPGSDVPLRAMFDAGAPGPETSTFELALAVQTMAAAVLNKEMIGKKQEAPPLAGRTRGDLVLFLRDLAVSLARRQEADGTWGGAVDTAWSMAALHDATMTSPLVKDEVGEGWRRAGPAVLERWWMGPEPEGLGTVERLHRTTAVWIAGKYLSTEGEIPPASWYQARSHDLDPGEDADTWFAAAILWMRFGPSKDPDHPLQGCKTRIRDAYLGGRLVGRSPAETFALTAAIECFGYDAFGSAMGYLPDDNWPPREGK